VCIRATQNGVVDLNVANDNFCKTAFFGKLGQEEKVQSKFKIFPNPAISGLNIDFSGTGIYTYKISNSLGRLIQHDTLQKHTIDISDLEAGIYIFSLFNNKGKILENH
jgi:hypothetical protein